MNWATPEYAWLLLIGIPAALLARWAALRRRRDLGQLLEQGATRPRPALLQRGLTWLLPATVFLLIVAALCRPQWGQEMTRQSGKGLDILVALDVSRSMLADDLPPTRLAAAKAALAGLLPRLQGDRIGLIAFAGSAFQVCPLTSDYNSFGETLAETDTSTIPLGGTALASALIEAQRAFGHAAGSGKVLILISDGEDQGSDVTQAAAALHGVTVYSVAVGSVAGGLIPLPGGNFLKDRQGAIVRSRMQVDPLRSLALASGGRSYVLAEAPQALAQLYAVARSSVEQRQFTTTRPRLIERYQIPLALALLLLLLDPWLRWRGRP